MGKDACINKLYVFLIILLFSSFNAISGDFKSWHVNAKLGANFLAPLNNSYVVTASSYPSDFYNATESNASLVYGVGIFKKYKTEKSMLPFFSLGIDYIGTANNTIKGKIKQYQWAWNYDYQYKESMQSLLFAQYWQLPDIKTLNPYLFTGIGWANVKVDEYQEYPLGAIIPRVSPGFASARKNSFSFALGGGFSFLNTEHAALSIEYRYQYAGSISLGDGPVRYAVPGPKLIINNQQVNLIYSYQL